MPSLPRMKSTAICRDPSIQQHDGGAKWASSPAHLPMDPQTAVLPQRERWMAISCAALVESAGAHDSARSMLGSVVQRRIVLLAWTERADPVTSSTNVGA